MPSEEEDQAMEKAEKLARDLETPYTPEEQLAFIKTLADNTIMKPADERAVEEIVVHQGHSEGLHEVPSDSTYVEVDGGRPLPGRQARHGPVFREGRGLVSRGLRDGGRRGAFHLPAAHAAALGLALLVRADVPGLLTQKELSELRARLNTKTS